MKLVKVAALALAGALAAAAAAPPAADDFSLEPWLEDLRQMRDALSSHYSHLEWAVYDREADLPALWKLAEGRLRATKSEAEAREVFTRFLDYFGDGHLRMAWAPAAPSGPGAGSAPEPVGPTCSAFGYRSENDRNAVALAAPNYTALDTPESAIFPAGIIAQEGRRIGAVRIQRFDYRPYPSLCEEAMRQLRTPRDEPCDEECAGAVEGKVAELFNAAYQKQIEALAAERPDALIVDLAGNGGGTEWAEVALRTVTPVRVKSFEFGMVRHPHWVNTMEKLDARLAEYEPQAKGADKALIADKRRSIADALAALRQPCDMAPVWEGKKPGCSMLVKGVGSSAGIMSSADPDAMRALPWGSALFEPAAYAFREGVWTGPLILLVDQKTASASEQFAGILQANEAAVVMGAPTLGAGCGYTWGGIETRLKNSGARVMIPDCVRFGPEGDDIGGIDPDVPVGFRPVEGRQRRVGRFMKALDSAVEAAEAQKKRAP